MADTIRHAVLTAISVMATLVCTDLQAGTIVLSDPMEQSEGWELIGGGWGTDGQMGFNASAGNYYWGSSWERPARVGLEKTFSGLTVIPGSYTLTIETMCPGYSDYYFPVPLDHFSEFGLMGISATHQIMLSAPTPQAGVKSWTCWTLQYFVPPDSPDIGNPVGFKAVYEHPNNTPYSVMLDDVHVTFEPVPEPTTSVVFGAGVLALIHYARRRRGSQDRRRRPR